MLYRFKAVLLLCRCCFAKIRYLARRRRERVLTIKRAGFMYGKLPQNPPQNKRRLGALPHKALPAEPNLPAKNK